MLLQGNAVTAIELTYMILWLLYFSFKNYNVKPHLGVFGSPLFSDSTALSSNTFEVSNIYNCNNIGVCCLNAEWLFVAFR